MKKYILSFVVSLNVLLGIIAFNMHTAWERCDVLEFGVWVLLIVWFVCDLLSESKMLPKISKDKFMSLPIKEKIEVLKQGVQIIDG